MDSQASWPGKIRVYPWYKQLVNSCYELCPWNCLEEVLNKSLNVLMDRRVWGVPSERPQLTFEWSLLSGLSKKTMSWSSHASQYLGSVLVCIGRQTGMKLRIFVQWKPFARWTMRLQYSMHNACSKSFTNVVFNAALLLPPVILRRFVTPSLSWYTEDVVVKFKFQKP